MKRGISLILCAALLCALLCTGVGAFSDVEDAAVSEAAELLAGLGVVNGFEDGSYRPEQALTRAQFCKLAVTVLGLADSEQSRRVRSLFSDVDANAWYAGYVNLACEKGLINGYGDGRFGPEDSVSYAHALTILLRLLGYTDAQVGTLWPRDQIAYAKGLGLCEGVAFSANDTVRRGEAALLFRNLLLCDSAEGRAFYLRCCASAAEDVVVLSNTAQAEDGTRNCLMLLQNGSVTYVQQSYPLSDRYVGETGTVLLDEDGKCCGFLPDEDVTHCRVSVAAVTAETLTAADGSSYTMADSCSLLQKDTVYRWANAYTRVKSGSTVTLYRNAAGRVLLVWVSGADTAEAVLAPYADGAENLRYLRDALGLTGEVTLYKNGEAATAEDIGLNDVATADTLTGALFLSDRTVTGILEAVSPSADNVTRVTVSGSSYTVLSRGAGSFAGFSVGDWVTLHLTEGLEAAAVSDGTQSKTVQVGVLQRSGNGYAVTLPGGIVLSGSASGAIEDRYIGALVKVTAYSKGKISLSPLRTTYEGADLCISQRTLGEAALAPGAVVYDWAGSGSVTEIDLSALTWTDTIPAASIRYVHWNALGQADLLLLEDVTRDGYTYGIAQRGVKAGAMSTVTTITVTNGSGSSATLTGGGKTEDGDMVGVIGSGFGAAVSVLPLTAVTVQRDDFDGTDSVLVQGFDFPVWEQVQVYNENTGKWYTDSPEGGTALEQALRDALTLTVYYDRMPSEGGRIRVITVG